MRRIFFVLALCLPTAVIATAPMTPPKELDAARKALVAAIMARDVNAAASLSNFPLAVDMYRSPPTLTKKAFLAKETVFIEYFGDGDKGILACIGSGPLAYQGDKTQFGANSWFADCNGNEYYFGLRGGKWLFTAYQNINE